MSPWIKLIGNVEFIKVYAKQKWDSSSTSKVMQGLLFRLVAVFNMKTAEKL